MEKGLNSQKKKRKKNALGMGIDALLPNMDPVKKGSEDFRLCDINHIHPNRHQPRVNFSPEKLKELSDSIKAQGVLQPLMVRRDEVGYELIAGERRLRASKMAGISKVPVIVMDISDDKLLEISLIENIQRQDLNPMEEAEAYYRLSRDFNLTQDEISLRVGKGRSTIANFVRLRQLPDEIKESITKGLLSMGHARALAGAQSQSQQIEICRAVISQGLSVRQTEKLVNRLKSLKEKKNILKPSSEDIFLTDLANNLSRDFGTKVNIKRLGKKGRVEIEFYSNEDLDRLINLLKH